MLSMNFKGALVKSDFWVGMGMILFGIVMIRQTHPEVAMHGLFPKLVFGSAIVMGLLVFLSAIKDKPSTSSGFKFTWMEIIVTLMLFLNIYFISIIGFYTSAFISSFILLLILFRRLTVKSILTSLLYSIVLMVVAFVVFTNLLGIQMPQGIFM